MDTQVSSGLSDRQARALIAAAEQHGFKREAGCIWWRYDEMLHTDAGAARSYLQRLRPELIAEALDAPESLPSWVAVERIANERRGLTEGQMKMLIDAAVASGLMSADDDSDFFLGGRWHSALEAIGLLWSHDPDALTVVLGDRARLALLPEDAAVAPCPSACENGWIEHRFAGELPDEPPRFGYRRF